MPTVLLFDVDGTLISSGGAGRCAMERAFAALYGTATWLNFSFAGMTDPAVVRAGLNAGGVPAINGQITQAIDRYLDFLPDDVAQATDYCVHPGIVEALDAARAKPSTAVGLGTGNVRQGAQIKLARPGLNDFFSFGGYGCDDEERATLIRIGAERGAAQLGVPRTHCRVVVIGDTPKDIAAAQAIGAESLAVATGPFDVAALAAAGATYAAANLAAPGALDFLLGSE